MIMQRNLIIGYKFYHLTCTYMNHSPSLSLIYFTYYGNLANVSFFYKVYFLTHTKYFFIFLNHIKYIFLFIEIFHIYIVRNFSTKQH